MPPSAPGGAYLVVRAAEGGWRVVSLRAAVPFGLDGSQISVGCRSGAGRACCRRRIHRGSRVVDASDASVSASIGDDGAVTVLLTCLGTRS